MILGDICNFKVNYPEADFWLVRKGSENMVGKPTKTFSPEHIGVKVTDTQRLLPDFLYYYMQYLNQAGFFKQLAKGTTNLKHIVSSDLHNLQIQEQ